MVQIVGMLPSETPFTNMYFNFNPAWISDHIIL